MADTELTDLTEITTRGVGYWAYVAVGSSTGDSKKMKIGNLLGVDTVAGIDPTGSADSASAINSALSACHSAGGGTVALPRGTFKIGSALTTFPDVLLTGVGIDSTVLKASANITMLALSQATRPELPCNGFGVRDLTIDGNSTAAIGLRIGIYYNWNLMNLRIRRCNTYGLYLIGAPVGNCYNVNLTENVVGCFATKSADDCQTNLINWYAGRHEFNTGWCFDVEYCAAWNFYGGNMELSGTIGDDDTGVMRFSHMTPVGAGWPCVNLNGVWCERNSGFAVLQLNPPVNDDCHSYWNAGISKGDAGTTMKYGIWVAGDTKTNIFHATNLTLGSNTVKDILLTDINSYFARGPMVVGSAIDVAAGYVATYGLTWVH